MGYGPESIEPSEGGLSRRFPTGMRPPNEGTALSISDKELELFTGIIEVQQDKAGGGAASSQAIPSTGYPWQLRGCGSDGSRRRSGWRL